MITFLQNNKLLCYNKKIDCSTINPTHNNVPDLFFSIKWQQRVSVRYLLDKAVHVGHGRLIVLPSHLLTMQRQEVRFVRVHGLWRDREKEMTLLLIYVHDAARSSFPHSKQG